MIQFSFTHLRTCNDKSWGWKKFKGGIVAERRRGKHLRRNRKLAFKPWSTLVRHVSHQFYQLRMLALYFLFAIVSFSNGIWLSTASERSVEWYKPGCHKVGHTRKVDIKDCVSFDITTNACRGFCESWAVPSNPKNSQITQPVTSIGTCCNIMQTEPMEVRVGCKDGIRTFVFKSAVTCSCYHCKKD